MSKPKGRNLGCLSRIQSLLANATIGNSVTFCVAAAGSFFRGPNIPPQFPIYVVGAGPVQAV